ncbi:ABC transporter related [Thermofilum pendens Hrk 5]|uniref:ABC transporter related n=1 Tax=Thermofilum pendens (strain DSM 2475 / Hrk 5) TaxID=368408 RepID=A1RW97_THEPD|nr:ABC transporter related [Thermofilum pendens Hrk 5]
MAEVLVNNLSVFYHSSGLQVLKGVSFQLDRGECLLLLGPTGSGKSTLLLTLAGAIPQVIPASVSGELSVGGKNPVEEGLLGMAGKVGLLFQDPEAQVVMPTVFEEVAFPMENLLEPPERIVARVGELLDLVSLKRYARSEVDTLSTGLKQKLALASVLAMDPEVFLLDEPTAHIDPRTAKEIYALVKRLKDEGKTFILVEHRVEYVAGIADKVLYLEDGRGVLARSIGELVEKVGAEKLVDAGVWIPPEYLPRKNPANPRTAGTPRENREPLVDVSSLEVRAGPEVILRDVSLRARRGEVTLVIGPNGSGKTTLLKAIAGLVRPSSGEVRVAGGRPSPRLVAFVAQIPDHQFTERTVVEEVASVLGGSRREERLRRARRVLEARGLGHLSDRVVYELSQGEKRLVSFVEMYMLDKPVYLLDEPTFGLDFKYSLTVARSIAELASSGKAVVVVTHDSWILPLLSPKVYGLSHGRIVFEGELPELLTKSDVWKYLNFEPPAPLKGLANIEEARIAVQEYAERLRNYGEVA